jgi:hypothetical protein
LGFAAVGKIAKTFQTADFAMGIAAWSMGAALFAHAISFISVSYFDQIQVFWYFLMAAIAIYYDSSETVVEKTQPEGLQLAHKGASAPSRFARRKTWSLS